MQSLRPHGAALLLGTLGYLAVMTVHPPGPSALLSPQDYSAALHRVVWVHSAGIALAPLVLFGVLGLVTLLRRTHLAVFAAVVYALATLALVAAVLLHGVVGPSVELEQQAYTPEARGHLKLFFAYLQQLNGVLERCFALGSLGATLMWSIALRGARLGSPLVPISGMASSALLLSGIVLGVMPLNHQGMSMAIAVPGFWFIAVALTMLTSDPGDNVRHAALGAGSDV